MCLFIFIWKASRSEPFRPREDYQMCPRIGRFRNWFTWAEESGDIRSRTPSPPSYDEATFGSPNLLDASEAFEYESTATESYHEEEDSLDVEGEDIQAGFIFNMDS